MNLTRKKIHKILRSKFFSKKKFRNLLLSYNVKNNKKYTKKNKKYTKKNTKKYTKLLYGGEHFIKHLPLINRKQYKIKGKYIYQQDCFSTGFSFNDFSHLFKNLL